MTKQPAKSSTQDHIQQAVSALLHERLFITGSELKQILQEKFAVTDANARKIISRLAKTYVMRSSAPYKFGKGQYIYMLRDGSLTLEMVKTVTKTHRKPIYRLLQALEDNNGLLSNYEAMKITASPSENSSTKVNTLRDIIKLLTKMNMIRERASSRGISFIFLNDAKYDFGSEVDEAARMDGEAKMIAKDALMMSDIVRWLAASNIMDFENTRYRSLAAPASGIWHNSLLWDAISYTRTTGINDVNASKVDSKEKKTFVAIDILVSKTYSNLHLDGFVSRIQIHQNSVKDQKRRVLPIVVYKDCSAETLGKMAKLGFLTYSISSIFGTKIYSILEEVGDLINNSGDISTIDASVKLAFEAIRESGHEEALNKIKGVLFEVLLYAPLSHIFAQSSIERNRIIKFQKQDQVETESYEYDYIIRSNHPKELIVLELKGYGAEKKIPLGDYNRNGSLKWFFGRTLPHILRFFKEEPGKGYPIRAVFITSSKFEVDAQKYLDTLNHGGLKSAHLQVGYDREELIKLLNSRGFKTEVEIIEKYFN